MTRRILIVDDDRLILRGMARTLQRRGWEVHTVQRADEGLELLKSRVIDAVIVDYDLGDHTGLDVLAWMQEHLHSTVRILMTGHDDLPAIVEAVNRGGAFKVLRKPFRHSELFGVLDGAMDNVQRFVAASVATARDRREAELASLQAVFDERQIRLAVQPIVSAATGHEVRAYEALMRPQSQRYPTPSELLVAAEEHGRVLDVGGEVLAVAAERLASLAEGHLLFVNLHPAQLGDPRRLELALKPLAGGAKRVVFELTERSRLSDIDGWEESVALLGERGFALAVDDLGAGYNALGMLADLQPDFIKLDMSLIRGIEQSARKQRLVQLLASFARATDATLIAEGVEEAEQVPVLQDCDVDLMQGYFFGRPRL